MKVSDLEAVILQKKSYLCVGLDPDVSKLPAHLPKNAEGVLEFCLSIIETTSPFATAYKLNSAFFESLGPAGWSTMQTILKTCWPMPLHFRLIWAGIAFRLFFNILKKQRFYWH
jgi:orotidine-5'-phosphate decarboxylase